MNITNIFKSFFPKKDDEIKIGDMCMWESQGSLQWVEYKSIVHIAELDGEPHAWFDGSLIGVKTSELIKKRK